MYMSEMAMFDLSEPKKRFTSMITVSFDSCAQGKKCLTFVNATQV